MKKSLRFLRIRYPKITLLLISIILAYIIFRAPSVNSFLSSLGNLSYLGIFIAGVLFSFGFTAAFAVGFFVASNPPNIILAGLTAGLGAMLADLIIFSFIRISFADEFQRLKNTKPIKIISKKIESRFGKRISIYLMYIFAGFIIASPLPDEAGVTMIAGLTKIKPGRMMALSFILNTIGIILILLLGK